MSRLLTLQPVVTEKSMALASEGQFTLFVPRGINKLAIAQAISSVYKVHVLSVNILRRASKTKRRGTITGATSERTKAIVRLKQGEKIPGFEMVAESAATAETPAAPKKQEKK